MKCLCHILLTAGAFTALAAACFGQNSTATNQSAPTVTGSGTVNYIPVWKAKTAVKDSVIYESGADIGIGTTTPAATLEVNGNAQVDGNLTLSGTILAPGNGGPFFFAPNNSSNNFGAGLSGLTSATTGTDNTAVGDTALHTNTTGSSNTATGPARCTPTPPGTTTRPWDRTR